MTDGGLRPGDLVYVFTYARMATINKQVGLLIDVSMPPPGQMQVPVYTVLINGQHVVLDFQEIRSVDELDESD